MVETRARSVRAELEDLVVTVKRGRYLTQAGVADSGACCCCCSCSSSGGGEKPQ